MSAGPSSSRATYRPPGLAVVVSGWPRVSETFAINEMLALRDRGLLGRIFATKPGDASLCQPGIAELSPHVTVLSDAAPEEQAAEVAAWVDQHRAIGVHGYFAHRPAEVAQLAARLARVPFGFSAHALDARKVTPVELVDRAAGSAVTIACNTEVAAALDTSGVTSVLVPHGVDTERFRPDQDDRRTPDGALRILAVGRLVPKKGFAILLHAVAAMRSRALLTVIGDGPERLGLESLVDRLHIRDRVSFAGRCAHDSLPRRYLAADVVAVPSVVDPLGDRDGLPNVLLEAMASGRPVIASDVAAIGAAVVDGVSGVLVPPGDAESLANALDDLADRPAWCRHLGRAARLRVERHFALRQCAARFCDEIEARYA